MKSLEFVDEVSFYVTDLQLRDGKQIPALRIWPRFVARLRNAEIASRLAVPSPTTDDSPPRLPLFQHPPDGCRHLRKQLGVAFGPELSLNRLYKRRLMQGESGAKIEMFGSHTHRPVN
jgi:hypothetical protein